MGKRWCAIHIVACASSGEIDELSARCRRLGLLPEISLLKNDSTSVVESELTVLFVGEGRGGELRRHFTQPYRQFNLLITHDISILECSELLARCAAVLVSSYDDGVLGEHLAGVERLQDDWEISKTLELNIVGESAPLRQMMRQVSVFSRYSTPVLLYGETGTGKELVARGIHYSSDRRDQSFVPVNCCAFNDDLLLGELFGYEKGAFTDAKRAHAGLVAQADGGTLFLDEIDSLSAKGQGALLRFLQDQEYRPIGGSNMLRSDVRVISATNKDLAQLVEQGRFREDLYYRLHILHVEIPPLRERHGDVALLADFFLHKFSGRYHVEVKMLHPLTLRWMEEYEWPGNVRELENYLHRIFVLSRGAAIFVASIKGDPIDSFAFAARPAKESEVACSSRTFRDARERMLNEFENSYLRQVMEAAGGNVSEAARRAGKERRTFGRLLKKHGIDRQSYSKG